MGMINHYRWFGIFTITALASAIHNVAYAMPNTVERPQNKAIDAEKTATPLTFEPIKITVNLLDSPSTTPSMNVIGATELRQRSSTLGQALSQELGIHSDSFGAGASRPVIRGQGAPRVKILSDSAEIIDASQVSPDHATTVEPLLARRVEIIKGPATLRYGGGAIGGVVNVLDAKIPTRLPSHSPTGDVLIRADTASQERTVAGTLTTALSPHIALHVEADKRRTADYKAGRDGYQDADGEAMTTVEGTWSKSQNVAMGLSWIGDRGYLGAAYTDRQDDYALPGHIHVYEDCHIHGLHLHCASHDMDHEAHSDETHEHEAAPVIQLHAKRVDVRGEYRQPMTGVDHIQGRLAYTDYHHDEIDAGIVGTTFKNKGLDGRLEIILSPLYDWKSAVGLHYTDTRFSALGEEAFLPETTSRSMALFTHHQRQWDRLNVEFGARAEQQQHHVQDTSRALPDYQKTTWSAATQFTWQAQPATAFYLGLNYAQRHPTAQELYAKGFHLATNTYEMGNARLTPEQSLNTEIGLRYQVSDFTLQGSLFFNRIHNYIFGKTQDRYDNFRLLQYHQADADFYGAEGQLSYQFSPQYQVQLFGDHTRAYQRDHQRSNLPRIPATRVGVRLNTQLSDQINTQLEWVHTSKQKHVSDFESQTPSYNNVNVEMSTQYSTNAPWSYQWFVQGKNLLNDNLYEHASYLAHVPQPGRNVLTGLRIKF